MKKYKIYTDGSCKGNGKKNNYGACGYIVLDSNNNKIYSFVHGYKNTTNQRMEMQAIYDSCIYIKENLKNDSFSCEIYTDSAYCVRCVNEKWYEKWEKNNWKNSSKEPIKNQDIWKKIIPFFNDNRFIFKKIKGHSDNFYNNEIDNIVQNYAEDLKNESYSS